MLASEVTLSAGEVPSNIDRALPLDVPYDLSYCILGRNRYQHMDMICQEVTLLYPALLPQGQLAKNTPKMSPQLFVEHLLSILRNKNDVILALPSGVA